MSRVELRILRFPELREKAGLKKSSLYAMMKANKFPRPIAIGARAVGWLQTEIDEWIEAQRAESRRNAK